MLPVCVTEAWSDDDWSGTAFKVDLRKTQKKVLDAQGLIIWII